jgi:hypothetical protein
MRKTFTIIADEDLLKQFKILAISNNKTLGRYIEELVMKELKSKESKQK